MSPDRPVPLVVMGVSGSGKTTVGEVLAARLGVPSADADAFHPQANIDKMSSGRPLDDDDRQPWLEAIGDWLHEHAGTGCVVGCSALKRSYRDLLQSQFDLLEPLEDDEAGLVVDVDQDVEAIVEEYLARRSR